MKKNILAIILVFSLLLSFAACRKLDSESITIESKVYIVDEEGVTRDVYNVGSDYYYYDESGNRIEADSKDVVVETNTVRVTESQTLTPEAQSFMQQFEDAGSIEDMMEADVTQPTLENDQLIPDDAFNEIEVDVDADGNPIHEEVELTFEEVLAGEQFTLDVKLKVVTNGTETVAPFLFMRDGDNLYFETAMPLENGLGSTRLNFILLNGDCYVVIPSMRAYMQIPKEVAGEMVPGADSALEGIEETEGTYVSSSEVVYNGQTYICDEYENEGVVTKRYYQGNQLKRIETVSGSDVSIMEVNEVSTSVDKSKFVAPKNYFDLATVYGNNFNPASVIQ